MDWGRGWQELGGSLYFYSSGMGGSSKIIDEVRGGFAFFRSKGSVKPVILCSVLDGNI